MILCLWAGCAVTLAMLGAWALQRAVGNAGWVDVIWTVATGLALATVALAAHGVGWRQGMLTALLLIWAVRLGGHVAYRVATGPEDTRYAQMRRSAGDRFQRWMFGLIIGQGPVTGLLALSVYWAAVQPAPGLRIADGLGVLILIGALAGEALADRQLQQWRADPANHGGICEAGLWALCRHPNYLFEALGWIAYPVIALDFGRPLTMLSLTAPVLMFLVLRYLTGVPPVEAAMLQRRGDSYRRYQARTNAMWPRFSYRKV
ncbi:DUF1295 domain-containing protein [Acidisoma sp. 7E03]